MVSKDGKQKKAVRCFSFSKETDMLLRSCIFTRAMQRVVPTTVGAAQERPPPGDHIENWHFVWTMMFLLDVDNFGSSKLVFSAGTPV